MGGTARFCVGCEGPLIYCYGSRFGCLWGKPDCSSDADCNKYSRGSPKYTDGAGVRNQCPNATGWRREVCAHPTPVTVTPAPSPMPSTPHPTSPTGQPVWSAANVYCDHKRRLNKERWGINPAQCKAKCIALKACRSYTSVVDAP